MVRDVELFREYYMFSQEDILKSLGLQIEHVQNDKELRLSSEAKKKRIDLLQRFTSAVKKSRLPVLTELWWFYDYRITGNSIELYMCEADEIEFEDDEPSSMSSSLEHPLIKVECEFLSVDEFSKMHNVAPVTVRQWIRRGKLRHAIKTGRDWKIPDIEDKPHRGFTDVQYMISDASGIDSKEFPLLSNTESAYISQNDIKKSEFECIFVNFKNNTSFTLVLSRSDVERLEHTIIESGKATAIDDTQFMPYIR